MTEQEWLRSRDLYEMLTPRPRAASHRKMRLFLCAWYRHFYWDRASDPRTRRAVELAELYADDLVTKKEVEAARRRASAARDELVNHRTADVLHFAVVTTYGLPLQAAKDVFLVPKRSTRGRAPCDLLREVLGRPSRRAPPDRSWLTWEGATVPKLARAIYDERAFDRLPVLADALEEAGCTDAAILGHCRGGGAHVRGCWVIDLLLGKA
jgi:hypothetical protein